MRIISPFLLTVSLLFAVTSAFGQDASPDADGTEGATPPPDTLEPCDPSTLFCSNGPLEKLVASSKDRLPTVLDTGWLPKCDPATSDGHCNHKLQFQSGIHIVPLRENNVNKNLYTITMEKSVGVDARWPEPGFIDLFIPPGQPEDGRIYIAHSILPEIALYINVKNVYKGEIKFDASTLIHKIPGAKFNYRAEGNQRFTPWAFENVSVNVKGNDLENSQLFSITFAELAEMLASANIDEYVDGKFALNLTTDLIFQYQTTRVQFSGASGIITFVGGSARIDSPDDDSLDVTASVSGTMRYSGKVQFFPTIMINKIGSIGVSLTYPIDLKGSIDLGNQNFTVKFAPANANIPLPNVNVATTPLSFPTTETGKKSQPQTIKIKNTGKLGGSVKISSNSKQFKISTTAKRLDPDDGELDLKVIFAPTRNGTQKGVITVNSNDPDDPVVTINVSGKGKGKNLESEKEANTPEQGGDGVNDNNENDDNSGYLVGGDDSGCGCTVVGSNASRCAAVVALLGLAAAAFRRRRR